MDILREPLPERVAWTGPALSRTDDWITCWTQAELDDLDRALRDVLQQGMGWGQFGREHFSLPATDRKFNRMRPSMARVLGLETRSAKEG